MAAFQFQYNSNRVIDVNGIADGATLNFFLSGTTTPTNVFADEAMTSSLGSVVAVPAGGAVPTIFINVATPTRCIVRNSDGVTIQDIDPVFTDGLAALASPTGAGMIGTTSGRTQQAVNDDWRSIEEFRQPGFTDRQAFEAACLAARYFYIPANAINLTNAVIPVGAVVRHIMGFGTQVNVTAALNNKGIRVEKTQFITFQGLRFVSTGSKTDGFNTRGIEWATSCSYQHVIDCSATNFSGDGFAPLQCAYFTFERVNGSNCGRWINFLPNAGLPCAAIRIRDGYVSGCGDGIYSVNGLTNYHIEGTIFEYCGDNGDSNRAALNITGGKGADISCYFEANFKNKRFSDAQHISLFPYELPAAPWPNTGVNVGLGFGDRGYGQITHRKLTITEIEADTSTGGNIRVTGALGIGGDPAASMTAHWWAPEVRHRYQATNPGGKFFELFNGGGGLAPAGRFGIYSESGGRRFECDDQSTPGLHVTGAGASTIVSLNGTQVLTTRGSAIAAPTGGATVDAEARTAINALRTELARHGLIAP